MLTILSNLRSEETEAFSITAAHQNFLRVPEGTSRTADLTVQEHTAPRILSFSLFFYVFVFIFEFFLFTFLQQSPLSLSFSLFLLHYSTLHTFSFLCHVHILSAIKNGGVM